MNDPWTRQMIPLVGAVVMLVIGMIGIVLVLWISSSQLSGAVRQITEDDVPSLVSLESAGSDLRQLQMLFKDRFHSRPGDPAVRSATIDLYQAGLEQSVRSYFGYSVDPGEVGLGQDVRRSLSQFDQVVKQLRTPAGMSPDRVPGLERDLDLAVGELDRALLRAARFNAEHARLSSSGIAAVPHQWLRTAIALCILADGGAMISIGLTFVSVRRTARTAVEKQELLQRKTDELEDFAGRIAHDLLSPLSSVTLALSVAERRLSALEGTRSLTLLTRAEGSIEQVRRLVDDLLSFARAGARPIPGALCRADAVVLEVADTFRPLAELDGIDLRIEPPPERVVKCSPGVLTSMLSNLLQNAIKHLGAGEVRRVEVRVVDDGPWVRFEVQDTGPGVGPDAGNIFEPYVRGPRARGEGIGLGLATVKRLAESHGGCVGVKSSLGTGSMFWFSLPRHA